MTSWTDNLAADWVERASIPSTVILTDEDPKWTTLYSVVSSTEDEAPDLVLFLIEKQSYLFAFNHSLLSILMVNAHQWHVQFYSLVPHGIYHSKREE